MKKAMKALSGMIIAVMVITFSIPSGLTLATEKSLTVLFTHDMHDHFLSAKVKKGDTVKELGGYARLSSAIKAERAKDPNLLLVDAGDFSMGTLFQSIYSVNAPGLRTMGMLGYEVTTVGNHEFDFRADGLAQSLDSAKGSGDQLPEIVASNLDFSVKDGEPMSNSLTQLQKAMGDYGVKEYTVIQKNGIKIGVFGAIGKDAISNAPKAEVGFRDEVDVAKSIVEKLKVIEKVDMIICLSHAGINSNVKKSEDEVLAKEVPEIDVIISGHTHSTLNQPIKIGKTLICSAGEYGENLGVLSVTKVQDGSFKLDNYRLRPIDETLPDDPAVSKKIVEYKQLVQNNYLSKFGLSFDEVIAESKFDFIPSGEIGLRHEEMTLANLITDAYIYAVKMAEGNQYEPVDVAIVPSGTIRGSFVKGKITVADAFTVSSLGIGADKVSGYPLISIYLTGKELRTACEVDASIAPIMSAAQLYMSGINYTFNPSRIIFNKVTEATLVKSDGRKEKIDNKKLYRVVAGLYSAQMLSVVSAKSFGLLSVVPKMKNGEPITDYEAQIIKDTVSGRNNEMKEWLALAEYLKSFEKVDGIPQIPEYYSKTQGRKVIDNDTRILSIIANPNAIVLVALGIVLVILLLIGLAIYLFATRKKRKSKKIAKRISHS